MWPSLLSSLANHHFMAKDLKQQLKLKRTIKAFQKPTKRKKDGKKFTILKMFKILFTKITDIRILGIIKFLIFDNLFCRNDHYNFLKINYFHFYNYHHLFH